MQQKLEQLLDLIKGLEKVVIAYSGGVDSTFLAAVAVQVLGDRAVAVTASSETLPAWEREEAVLLAQTMGIAHMELSISELNSPAFVQNDGDRCYHCKKERFHHLVQWAVSQGFHWVLDGSNADDCLDYRPGMKAVAEMDRVKSPLLEVGLTKQEIRKLSKEMGLATWDKPSAACLSSRVAYGLAVTQERLRQVEAAEAALRQFCTGQVRVRHHGELARIEVEPDQVAFLLAPENRKVITEQLKQLGFLYVTLDLAGYRTGSMNAVLSAKKPENTP